MIIARRFNETGLSAFRAHVENHYGTPGPSANTLISDPALSTPIAGVTLDEERKFASRHEFGEYLCTVLESIDRDLLLSPEYDNFWAWINAVYFLQLAPKEVRKSEHYLCVRTGPAGSLLHRNAARTAFEIVCIHGPHGRFALQRPMHTHGQLLESLSASQTIIRNRSFFAAAAKMYIDVQGNLKPGYGSKPKKPKDRKPGDSAGKGSIRRLPVALRRLDLTYDVEVLSGDELVAMLPREFARWTRKEAAVT